MAHIKRSTNLVLKRVFYDDTDNITHFIYWDEARGQYYQLKFDNYVKHFKDVFLFKNAYIVEDKYFRARTHKDIDSFEKIGGSLDGTNTSSTYVEQEDEKQQINTRRRVVITDGIKKKIRKGTTVNSRGTNDTDILQRRLRISNTESANTCPVIRYVKQAERISPKVFKGCFNNARKHLDEELRWFVTPRNLKDLNGFDCLSFRDKNNYPIGFVAVNAKTGDIGSLLRDKLCEMSGFTVNALAYNDKTGLVDLYGGQEDIYNSIIKMVMLCIIYL